MRRPAADERELWRRAMRDVAPLRRQREVSPDRAAPLASLLATPPPSPSSASGAGKAGGGTGEMPMAQPSATASSQPVHGHHPGIDRATAERLRRGRYPIEATLDLHGMTQDEAHRALSNFVAASRAAGRRGVIVVTGHGRTSGGVLKAAAPRWLDERPLRRHVLMTAPARPQHGGHGALYVLLRRPSR